MRRGARLPQSPRWPRARTRPSHPEPPPRPRPRGGDPRDPGHEQHLLRAARARLLERGLRGLGHPAGPRRGSPRGGAPGPEDDGAVLAPLRCEPGALPGPHRHALAAPGPALPVAQRTPPGDGDGPQRLLGGRCPAGLRALRPRRPPPPQAAATAAAGPGTRHGGTLGAAQLRTAAGGHLQRRDEPGLVLVGAGGPHARDLGSGRDQRLLPARSRDDAGGRVGPAPRLVRERRASPRPPQGRTLGPRAGSPPRGRRRAARVVRGLRGDRRVRRGGPQHPRDAAVHDRPPREHPPLVP